MVNEIQCIEFYIQETHVRKDGRKGGRDLVRSCKLDFLSIVMAEWNMHNHGMERVNLHTNGRSDEETVIKKTEKSKILKRLKGIGMKKMNQYWKRSSEVNKT